MRVARILIAITAIAVGVGLIIATPAGAHTTGRISVIGHAKVAEYLPLPGALAVEAGSGGKLYATTVDFTPRPARSVQS